MVVWARLGICVLGSFAVHVAVERGLDTLPPRRDKPIDRRVEVKIVAPRVEKPPPEPPKPPPPPPPPPKPTPKPVVHEIVKTPVPTVARAEEPKPPSPADTVPTGPSTDKPKFGVTMESTSQAGPGPSVPVGNTTRTEPTPNAPTETKPLAPAAAAHEVTKMPLPLGRCTGKYTDDAKQAGIEGTVVLDVVVDETGHTRDIRIVEPLGHGLTEAAMAALRGCRFSPGEKDGKPVPVRVRGFKVTFALDTP